MKILNSYQNICVRTYSWISSRKDYFASAALYACGTALICASFLQDASAGLGNGRIQYNDQRLVEATNAVLTYLEGSFGALVMVASGIGCIISAAFGQYRSAIGLLVVAIGSFILRSLVGTFFNDTNIQD